MKITFVLTFIAALFMSCTSSNRETETHDHNSNKLKIKPTSHSSKLKPVKQNNRDERKLRYLFFANGGLIGYYNDFTIVGCPRCDLAKESLESMKNKETIRTYIIQKDGSILESDGTVLFPKAINANGYQEWAIIDYEEIIEITSIYE